MEVIRHDLAGDAAFFIQKLMAKIDPKNILSVRELLNDLVGLKNFSPLRIGVLTAWEDGAEKDLCFRQFSPQLLDDHANTSAASVPLAFDKAVRDGRIKAGQIVVFEAMGGGFTWGAAAVRT